LRFLRLLAAIVSLGCGQRPACVASICTEMWTHRSGQIHRFADLARYGIIQGMRNEFTAIIEQDEDWHIAYCPEMPGANGQGRTKEEAVQSLREAIQLILDDRREEGLRGVPPTAIREMVVVG
jgi:predicted RNase H-like HicB family nuclease